VVADPGLSTIEPLTTASYKIVVVPARYAAIRLVASVTPQESLGPPDTVAIPWKPLRLGLWCRLRRLVVRYLLI